MKSSVKLSFCRWDILVIAVIAVSAAVIGWALLTRAAASGDGLTAVITQNGTVLESVDLSSIPEGESQEYTVNGDYTAVVELENSRVCIESSDCPNQDCVHTGWISKAGQSVVCLPNRLVVELTGTSGSDSGVDVVIG